MSIKQRGKRSAVRRVSVTYALHDLRHHCASSLVNAGVDLYFVSEVLGHADLARSSRSAYVSSRTLLAAVEAGAAKVSDLSH